VNDPFLPKWLIWITIALPMSSIATLCQELIAGADMSLLAFFESKRVVYKDNGQPDDALLIIKRRGINCVRLRIFTSSPEQAAADPYNYINNLDYTLPLAKRVKSAGLKLILDFHYSDTWADPQHQAIPTAWTNLSFQQLCQMVRSYTSNVIYTLHIAEATPDYVQIGNEITAGMLWPEGKVGGTNDTPLQWQKLTKLIINGIQGVRDVPLANPPKIIIHIDRGGDWLGAKWFFDNLTRYQVQFDIIGYSYYPWWHGPFSNLTVCISNSANAYKKPIMIVETAFPWTHSTNIYGIPATTNGQLEYVVKLATTVHSIPRQPVIGIIWWGAEYQHLPGYALAGFQYKSFWYTDGNVLPVVQALGQLAKPAVISVMKHTQNQILLWWPLSSVGIIPPLTTSLVNCSWIPLINNAPQTDGLTFSYAYPVEHIQPTNF
jgi:arabinogalactan endo-1,4-beta-galactosidase